MKKEIIILLLCMFHLLTSTVYAESETELNNQLKSKEAEIAQVEQTINDYEAQKETLKNEILEVNKDLEGIDSQLSELSIEIEAVSEELKQAQMLENEKKELFYKRLVVLYEKGNIEYIEAFLESNNIMEISKRYEYIKQISEYDRNIFDEYASARQEVDNKKAELDSISSEYQIRKSEFDQQISQANSEIAVIDENIKDNEETKKTLETEKTEIENQLYKSTYAGRIFAEGEKYLGYPYVWGGSTPETSFDCSGFVCWTYTNSGVYNLSRTTAQGIYNQCEKISAADAQPGDLIFFQGTYDAGEPVTHIGIYAGDNRMLHCGNPIQYTRTDSAYWQNHFYAYGRLRK